MAIHKKKNVSIFRLSLIDYAILWIQSSCFQLRHLGTLGKLHNIAEFQIPHLKMALVVATPFPSNFSIPFFSTNSA